MKKLSMKKQLALLTGAAAMGFTSFAAQALDYNGYTTANDAACWLNAQCSIPRGGDSDVMTIFNPNGTIYQQIFAFGNEEANNAYYFDPNLVSVDPNQFGNYTTLLEPDGITWSDTFGLANLPGGGLVLGFISDPNNSQAPIPAPPALPGLTYVEQPGGLNPVPEDPIEGPYLTKPYSATQYLSLSMQQQGYTATFQSDVPEPASLALVALGLAGLGWSRRTRS